MPTVERGSRVLVTGANGYISMWIISMLLEQGYRVRGTVRSEKKGKYLREYFGDKFELFFVEDIEKDGAFDEAVKDVDAIEHTVALVTLTGVEPDDYIRPALNGTLNVLKSALKCGDNIKRIVITSSVAAIYNPVEKPTAIFDETSWAEDFVKVVEQKGRDAEPIVKYSASKTLAEKAAWDLFDKHKEQVKWDLVVIHPPYVFGPTLQEVKKPEDMNVSMQIFWNMVSKDQPDEVLKATVGVVDVRDVAKAHVMALQKEAAGGHRIIVSNKSYTLQGIRNVVHSLQPRLHDSGVFPRGKPDLETPVLFEYNADKGKKLLGMQYISAEQMINDTLSEFASRGWLEKNVVVN